MIPEEKLGALHSLLADYMDEKNFSDEKKAFYFSNPSCQKILLQQIIRERAQQDGKDIDELVQGERTRKSSSQIPNGQVLGSFSRVEGVYADILIQEAYEKQMELSSSIGARSM
jgi:hypothetical protein